METKNHAYTDYSVGIILIAAAYLLNFQSEKMPNTVLYAVGTWSLLYSLLTNYELGIIKIIPINIHFMLDTVTGIFLATSPWLLGFSDKVFLPHLILGLTIIGAAIITSIKPACHQSTNFKIRKRQPLK
ncbi:SPW repeat domain-containing protein [Flavobacterium piscis]|nr:SPW repeat protein [Flavobacterium piscis]